MAINEKSYFETAPFYTNSLTGARTEYTYTPSGAAASLRTYAGEEIVSDMEYEYDLRGNQTKKTEDGRTTEYYYDALSRLKTALLPNGITQDYEFDDYGNIIRMAQVNGFSIEESNYCYDKNNRLLLKETVSDGKTVRDCYTYDAAGNTVRKETFTEENGTSTSAGTEYAYNGRNQLCNVALSSGESFAYTYNAEGLRSSKVSGDGTVNYVYQNGIILLETDGDGAVTAENIWGIRLLERRTSEAEYAYRFDGHGDIIALTDEHGTALEDYSYDPYGVDLREETTDIRNWESDSLSLDNPFRYCGEYLDEETGLYYLRARYYDPGTGRFISEDPARAGLNWYTYCENNPIIYKDSNGMKPYSVREGDGKYSLYVSPQWVDATQSGIGMIPVVGWGFSILNGINQRVLGGFREIHYDVSGTLSIVTGAGELMHNHVIQTISKWAGRIINVIEAGEYAYDWLYAHNYQIEEAISNQFDYTIWESSSRNEVDKKFGLAMDTMTSLMLDGKIGVAKAVDIFGKDAFHYNSIFGMTTYQYDPLTGQKKIFNQDDWSCLKNKSCTV